MVPGYVRYRNDDSMTDNVNHPSHYAQEPDGMECIEAIRGMLGSKGYRDYCRGNVLKYIWRYEDKGIEQDLLKARKYIDFMIEEVEHIEAE